MGHWEDRHEQALRHVLRGRIIIERQRALIERRKALGADTKQSEELLDRFEASQVIFEEDLHRFSRESG